MRMPKVYPKLLSWLAAVAFFFFAHSASAATFELRRSNEEWQFPIIVMRGEIEIGDASDLRQLLESIPGLYRFPRGYNQVVILDMDSEGGDFHEALALSQLISEYALTTYIGEGQECLSACAFAFMAGKKFLTSLGPTTSRVVHIDGRLAFHSPFPEQGDGVFFQGTFAVMQLLSLARDIPTDLIESALNYGPDEFIEVDTLRQAARWNIQLTGWALDEVDFEMSSRACRNYVNIALPFRTRPSGIFVELGTELPSAIFTPQGRIDHQEIFGGDWRSFQFEVEALYGSSYFEDLGEWESTSGDLPGLLRRSFFSHFSTGSALPERLAYVCYTFLTSGLPARRPDDAFRYADLRLPTVFVVIEDWVEAAGYNNHAPDQAAWLAAEFGAELPAWMMYDLETEFSELAPDQGSNELQLDLFLASKHTVPSENFVDIFRRYGGWN